MHPVSDPTHQVHAVLAWAEQAFERGDYLACGRLVKELTAEQVSHDQDSRAVLDRARDLEARLVPGRVTGVVGTICAALLAAVFIYYVIPW
jgi:hypothetical protein